MVCNSKAEELPIPSTLINASKTFYFTLNAFRDKIDVTFIKTNISLKMLQANRPKQSQFVLPNTGRKK